MASKWISPCILIVACITGQSQEVEFSDSSLRIRPNIERFNEYQLEKYRSAIQSMKNDRTYIEIANYHGWPFLCTNETGSPTLCCIHHKEHFPQWHRLYTTQFEDELLKHGWSDGLPYWDWTRRTKHLPDAVKDEFFVNSSGVNETNPLFQGIIFGKNVSTTRNPNITAFNSDFFLTLTLLALEETEYCSFAFKLERVHDFLHDYVGGSENFSMGEVVYASFDPIFFLHHSFVDKLWAIWQSLQRDRGLSGTGINCNETDVMNLPLLPFANTSINKDQTTFNHRYPGNVTDYKQQLQYQYDNLGFNNMTYEQVKEAIMKAKSRDRLFAVVALPDVATAVLLEIYICIGDSSGRKDCSHHAGDVARFRGGSRMGFVTSRPMRFEVSHVIKNLGLALTDHAKFDLHIKMRDTTGLYLDTNQFSLPKPSLLFLPREVGIHAARSSSSFNSTGFLLLVSLTLLVTGTAI